MKKWSDGYVNFRPQLAGKPNVMRSSDPLERRCFELLWLWQFSDRGCNLDPTGGAACSTSTNRHVRTPHHPADLEHRHSSRRGNYCTVRIGDFETSVTFAPIPNLSDRKHQTNDTDPSGSHPILQCCAQFCSMRIRRYAVRFHRPHPLGISSVSLRH